MNMPVDPRNVPIPPEIQKKWHKIVNILTGIMHIPTALIMKVDYPAFAVFQPSDPPDSPFKAKQEFTLAAGVYCEKTMGSKGMVMAPNALKDP